MHDRKWSQTIELADRILVLQPNEPDVLTLKIRALVSGGLQSEAINAMASLRKLYPQRAEDLAEAMSSQGASQFAVHRYSDAFSALEFVARVRNNSGSLKNLGEVLFALPIRLVRCCV
jgi:Flp pilus assembly protein TadD